MSSKKTKPKNVKDYRFIWSDKVDALRIDLRFADGSIKSIGPVASADFPILQEILARSPLRYDTEKNALLTGYQSV